MRITIEDIAKKCGVSVGTVDRAINNRFGISEKTKKKVLDMVKEMNYLPNHAARSLATGSMMTIGIVCFDLYNNFFPILIDSIEAKAKEKGYFINLILSHKDFNLEKEGIDYLFSRQVDGIILFPIGIGKEYIEKLKIIDIPIVTIYNKLSSDFSFVGVDDFKAMSDAVVYIAEKKYNNIIYITPSIEKQEKQGLNTYTLKQRRKGYREGMKNIGMGKHAIVLEGTPLVSAVEEAYQIVRKNDKTAILCACDSYALQVMKLMKEKDINTPVNYGLMGYDDIDVLDIISPRLTTIKYSVRNMGDVVFNVLFELINKGNIRKQYLLPYEIVDGETMI